MIKILFNDGDMAYYKKGEYDRYLCDDNCFLVMKDNKLIGIYPLHAVTLVEIISQEE